MIVFKDLSELTIMDDYMFGAVMSDEANIRPLIEYVLNIRIRSLRFIEPQRTIKEGYKSRGVRLDMYVEDEDGVVYTVEVQTTDEKNLPKRMRYYQSVVDVTVLSPGVDYEKLRKSFIIFICNYDPFHRGRYIYTFENRCAEDPALRLEDETVKVIVNTKGTVGDISDKMKELIRYLDSGIATGAYTKTLDKAVTTVKASEERRHEYMIMMIREMEILEKGRAEGRAEGEAKGREEAMCEAAEKMAAMFQISVQDAKKALMSN